MRKIKGSVSGLAVGMLLAGSVQAAPPVAVIDAPSSMPVKTRFTIMANRSSDSDGQITGYLWRIGGGAEVFTEGPSIDVRIPTPGSVEFSLTAIDNQWQLSAPVTARVIARDQTPPVAVMDLPTGGRVGGTYTLDARRSSDDGRIIRYQWTIGTAAPIVTDQPQLRQTFPTAGNQTIRLTVIDESGNTSAPVEGALNIVSPPVAVVRAPRIVPFGQAVNLDGQASFAYGARIIAYRWQVNAAAPRTTTEPVFVHPALPIGRHSATLTVEDDSGLVSTADTYIFIVADQTPPVAVFQGPAVTQTGAIVEFFAHASSDIGGRVREFRWQIGGQTLSTDQPNLRHTFTVAGVQPVTLTVVDDSGNESAPVMQRVVVQPSTPVRVPTKP